MSMTSDNALIKRLSFAILAGMLVASPLLLIPDAFAQSVVSTVEVDTAARTLRIGRISGNPRKHAGRLAKFGSYIAIRHDSFDRVEVVLKNQADEMIAAAGRGEIDLISETVFTALRLEQDAGMEMRVLELKDSVRAYHSVILVRADSDIHKLDDLRGSRIAFEDRGSTSGFFLPYVEMMKAGLNLVPEGGEQARSDEVRYLIRGNRNQCCWRPDSQASGCGCD